MTKRAKPVEGLEVGLETKSASVIEYRLMGGVEIIKMCKRGNFVQPAFDDLFLAQ